MWSESQSNPSTSPEPLTAHDACTDHCTHTTDFTVLLTHQQTNQNQARTPTGWEVPDSLRASVTAPAGSAPGKSCLLAKTSTGTPLSCSSSN